MYEVGQKVLVISATGVATDATVLATAKGDGGPGAYRVALHDLGADPLGEWHKAADIFVVDQSWEEKKESWERFLKE